MKGAARLGDQQVCPLMNPPPTPGPHIGGPVQGPGATKVLINNLPATLLGDLVICSGPPAQIISGSSSVFIEGKPAVRMGDFTNHGGQLIMGSTNVFIGG